MQHERADAWPTWDAGAAVDAEDGTLSLNPRVSGLGQVHRLSHLDQDGRHDLYALASAGAALALAALAGLASGAGVSLTFFTFGWLASSARIWTSF